MENQNHSRAQKTKVDNLKMRASSQDSSFFKKNRNSILQIQKKPTLQKEHSFLKLVNFKNLHHQFLHDYILNFSSNFQTENMSLSALTRTFLAHKNFNRYTSCQILLHQKGNPYFLSFTNLDLTNTGKVQFDIKSFNSIFNSIKKSKAKVFNQSTLIIPHLEILGHFLAKEIEFKNFNVVIILSMNSFLPNTKEEIEDFNFFVDLLAPKIQIMCNDISQIEHNKILNHIYSNFPFGIEVLNNDKLIYRNQFFENHKKDECNSLRFSHILSYQIDFYYPKTENASAEVYHFQRIALLGELLNTLQHELSNPLFGIKLASDLLKLDARDEDIKIMLHEINLSAERSQGIISNFSNLYQEEQVMKPTDLLKTLEETLKLTKSETKQINKKIENQCSSIKTIAVDANPSFLSQIIFNLVINSSQAIKSVRSDFRNDLITLTISEIDQHTIRLSIRDTGPGINSSFENKIFEPFFTTKATGTGLGLSICQSLAKKMNTELSFSNNSPSPGVTFSIDFRKA